MGGEKTKETVIDRGYVPHVRPRGEDTANARSLDPTKTPRRWVVERLPSWLNRSRRLLVRWEKRNDTYLAFIQLACALLCFQQCDRFLAIRVSEYGLSVSRRAISTASYVPWYSPLNAMLASVTCGGWHI